MATKTISTYISGSYELPQNYTTVTITAAGGVGGNLTLDANNTTVVNYGRLRGRYALASNYYITLANEPGATIISARYGVQAQGLSIANRGVISGGRYGVDSTVFGGIVHNGLATYTNAQISGYQSGIALNGGVSTITNFGTVTSHSGYAISAYGSVTNGSGGVDTALISGAGGVHSYGYTGLTNFGAIRASTLSGVELQNGGVVINGSVSDTEALITGYISGVYTQTIAAAVDNFGTIRSTGLYLGHLGVKMAYGGTVTNGALTDTAALIEGYRGVGIYSDPGTVNNFGSIVGQGHLQMGVDMPLGGSVSNGAPTDRSALISGYSGITSSGIFSSLAVATISNAGTIRGQGGVASGGIVMGTYCSLLLTNGSSGNNTALIEGYTGVAIVATSTMTNFGSIIGEGTVAGPGVYVAGAGPVQVTNGGAGHAGALIEGFIGVVANAADATVTNYGVIAGFNGVAVSLGASDVLVVEAGSSFVGLVNGGGGTLELANGTGTLTGLLAGGNVTVSGSMATTTFNNFATVQINSVASFALAGAGGTVATGQTLNVSGTLSGAGTLSLAGGAASFGTGASLTIAKVSQSGGTASFTGTNVTVADAWTQQKAGIVTVATGDRVTFTGTDSFSGTLTGAGSVYFTGGTDALTSATLSAAAMVVSGGAVSLSGATVLSKLMTVVSPNLTIAAAGATLSGGGTLYLNTLATSAVIGASASATLTNSDKIQGAGQLGDGQLTLINAAAGGIDAELATALTINTGTGSFSNAGLVESTSTGGLTIVGALTNTGTLSVTKGTLLVGGAVSGAGTVKIGGGVADFASTFSENVAFTSTTGVLELSHSQTYAGQVTGLSKTGTSSLDLLDIAFGGTTKATFSGTTTSGTLTVTDGTHTAHITLEGNYVGHTFTVSADGHGGTTVVDPSVPKGGGHVAPLITAMAGFGGDSGAGLVSAPLDRAAGPRMLAAPA